MKLIPYDEEQARVLDNVISREPAYQTVEQFITLYNDGSLQTTTSDVNTLARRIVDTYSNIDLRHKKMVVLSENETILEIVEVLIPQFKFIATLQRICDDLLSENYPIDVKLVFNDNTGNYIHILNDEGVPTEYIGAEKIPNLNEWVASSLFLQKLMTPYGVDGVTIYAKDIVDLDLSSINKIGQMIKAGMEGAINAT